MLATRIPSCRHRAAHSPRAGVAGDGSAGLSVAITFDTEFGQGGHEGARHLEAVLASLSDSGVRATFFVQGRWARAHPALLARIHAEGHLVGNHSYTHLPFGLLPSSLLKRDVLRAERAIADVLGEGPRPWLRCPYGNGGESPRVRRALSDVGYVHVGWTTDSGDWRRGSSAEGVSASVIEACTADRVVGSIVLMHSWPAATAGALPVILSALRAQSASLVGVDELVASWDADLVPGASN